MLKLAIVIMVVHVTLMALQLMVFVELLVLFHIQSGNYAGITIDELDI